MLRGSLALGRLGGIEVRAHATWGVALALLAYVTTVVWFPAQLPGLQAGTYLAMGGCAALLFFVSVLVHELAHAAVGSARGCQPRVLLLLVYGGLWDGGLWDGAATLSASDEFLISIVGPLSSFGVAVVLMAVGRTLGAGPAGALLALVALENLVLGVIHLLQAQPFDGGKVVHSLVLKATGSGVRTTQIVGLVGQLTAGTLIVFGISQVLVGAMYIGATLGISGWFIAIAVGRSRQLQAVRDDLATLLVADLMDTRPAFASPEMTVAEFVWDHSCAVADWSSSC